MRITGGRIVSNRLGKLRLPKFIGEDPRERNVAVAPHAKEEGLVEWVNRAKAKWLKRVMYHTPATSTERCFAYAVSDHLNAVTLDCWPSQLRLVKLFGFKCTKTIHRAAYALQEKGVLKVTLGSDGCRYAPVFNRDEMDIIVPEPRQPRPPVADSGVGESLLLIQSKSSSSEAAANGSTARSALIYRPAQRGALEVKVAELLGRDGFDVLSRLAQLDPIIIDRLCRAYLGGALGAREVAAARLAAEQA
jgi:hypothetical protein